MLRVFFGAPVIYCSKNVVVCWDGPLSGFEMTWMFMYCLILLVSVSSVPSIQNTSAFYIRFEVFRMVSCLTHWYMRLARKELWNGIDKVLNLKFDRESKIRGSVPRQVWMQMFWCCLINLTCMYLMKLACSLYAWWNTFIVKETCSVKVA